MNEVVGLVTSPAFWFGSVIVGVLINLASAYVKTPLDAWLDQFSQKRRMKSAARAARDRVDIERMAVDTDYMQYAFQTELRLMLDVLLITLFLVLVTIVASWFITVSTLTKDPIGATIAGIGFVVVALLMGVGLIGGFKEVMDLPSNVALRTACDGESTTHLGQQSMTCSGKPTRPQRRNLQSGRSRPAPPGGVRALMQWTMVGRILLCRECLGR